jgi:Mg2+/Co2+ transporter CorB
MSNLFFFLVIIVFGVLAAFLSASETAVTAASPLRLHQMAKKNDPRAITLLGLQENMPILISSILLANICLLNFMTSLATQLFMNSMGPIGVAVAPFVMSTITVLYVEVMPKIYVYGCPEKAVLFLLPVLTLLKRVFFPFTTLMNKIAEYSLAIFGVRSPQETRSAFTSEDLRGAIDLHVGGVLSNEKRMLRSILDLSVVSVAEIMLHRKNIVSFNIDLPFSELCEKIFSVPYTRVPLWQDTPDNIVGVIHMKNLVKALRHPSESMDIRKLMKTPWFIPDSNTLFHQLEKFKEKHIHQAFVVDEYGALLGMITLEDILEEIVGEIRDEHDVDLPGVRVLPQGKYLIRGCVTLRDLARQYDWDFGTCSVSTIAGLILDDSRSIPEVGATLNIRGFQIKVVRKHHHQITLVEVCPVSENEQST